MPRIPPIILDNIFYLYHDASDARAGKDFGGTGFIVAVRAKEPGRSFLYAVSNWHVVARSGASVIRLNTKDGGTDVLDLGPEEWDFDPRFDVAVKIIELDHRRHKISLILPGTFVTREKIASENLGPGEDLFMVGRFIDHDGGTVNMPAVRFGNISVMPSPIKQPNGCLADAYCIDLHSRSGYSGSPVFVYRTPGYDLTERGADTLEESSLLFAGTNFMGLLGIHFAQFPERWEVGQGTLPKEEGRVPLIREGAYVKGLSGMACVLPAWTILEVLNMEKLKRERGGIVAAA